MTDINPLDNLPIRKNFEVKKERNFLLERLDFHMELIRRIEKVEYVEIKYKPYLSRAGEVLNLPGPLTIAVPRGIKVSQEEENDETDDEENSNEVPLREAQLLTPSSHNFIAKNEFGHVRIQPLMDIIEEMEDVSDENIQLNLEQSEVGGHCVLSSDDFFIAISRGWGFKHPFAGKLHPIIGNVIPDTTIVYFSPRNKEELEVIWMIIQRSYYWVLNSSS